MERYIGRFLSEKEFTPELFEQERFFSVEKGDTFYKDLEQFKSVYNKLRLKWQECTVVGDKIPRLYTNYHKVFEHFTEARVIFISRNIIDVASSFKRRANDATDQLWPSDRDAAKAIGDWNAAHSQTLHAITQFPERILVVSYENLFIDKNGLDALFDFVDLKPTTAVRDYFNIQSEKSGQIRSRREENLSPNEKLSICLRADFASFRELLKMPKGEMPDKVPTHTIPQTGLLEGGVQSPLKG